MPGVTANRSGTMGQFDNVRNQLREWAKDFDAEADALQKETRFALR